MDDLMLLTGVILLLGASFALLIILLVAYFVNMVLRKRLTGPQVGSMGTHRTGGESPNVQEQFASFKRRLDACEAAHVRDEQR